VHVETILSPREGGENPRCSGDHIELVVDNREEISNIVRGDHIGAREGGENPHAMDTILETRMKNQILLSSGTILEPSGDHIGARQGGENPTVETILEPMETLEERTPVVETILESIGRREPPQWRPYWSLKGRREPPQVETILEPQGGENPRPFTT
jgi:hypothetical protein